jgi:sortase B
MKKKKNNKRNIIIKIIMFICLIVLIYSIYNIIDWHLANNKTEIIQEEIKEIIDDTSKDKNDIDFVSLKKKNKEIVAYLKVPGTKIDYVVVKGKDNSYYLKHNLYKQSSVAGWIFMDYHNKLDGNDKNIVIYGHNTYNGTMFGTLRNVIKKSWYENIDNHTFNLVLENEVVTYQVFSTYSIKVEDYYINTKFKNNNEFDKFVKTLKRRSVYNYNVEVNGEDSILTLSTCTGGGKSRMVLHAKRIDLIP